MKKILFFTGNRAEFGLQVPLIDEIKNSNDFKYGIIVSGSHLDISYGKTISEINNKNYSIIGKIKLNPNQNIDYTPKNISLIISKITPILKKFNPDVFIAFADRFETFAATIAASMMNICIAHVEGGDITNGGTFDDNIRHCITKLSHVHFASTLDAKKIILRLGEESHRVFNVGFTGLDNIKKLKLGNQHYLNKKYKLEFKKQIILFTFHPLTSNFKNNIKTIKEPINVLKKLSNDYDIILTFPNNDLGSIEIIKYIKNSLKKFTKIKIYKSLGNYDYLSFMSLCLKDSKSLIVMGNSSSGIKETMSFKCPVINIKPRQNGRVKACNVIDVNPNQVEIISALNKINSNKYFIKKLRNSKNIYGDGKSSERILKIIKNLKINNNLMIKKHYE